MRFGVSKHQIILPTGKYFLGDGTHGRFSTVSDSLELGLAVTLVNGATVKALYKRIHGSGDGEVTCARDALDTSDVAIAIDDASKTCANLDGDWGSADTLSFEAGKTYFQKNRVVEIYENPLVLGDTDTKTNAIIFPITFAEGAYVDMTITFTNEDQNGFIKLLDTVDDGYQVYSGPSETMMISMSFRPTSSPPFVYFKTWRGGWANHGSSGDGYIFTAQTTHIITFKAIAGNHIQVLFNGAIVKELPDYVPSKDARLLHFSNSGMLLNKIEFVGV